jgi:hypothetical protein
VDSFRDRGRIAPWAVQAVAQDEAAGLIRGYPDGTFRPDGVLTRAEGAAMLAGLLRYLGDA